MRLNSRGVSTPAEFTLGILNMLTWFNNLKIGTKIWSGNGLILALLAFVAAIAYLGLTQVGEDFARYRQIARQTNELGRIQANIQTARVDVKSYFETGNESTLGEVSDRLDSTKQIIDTALPLFDDEGNIASVNEIKSDVATYADTFKQASVLFARDSELNATLNTIGPKAEASLTKVMKEAFSDNNLAEGQAAALAMRDLMMVRVYAVRYMSEATAANANEALAEYQAFDEALGKLSGFQIHAGRKAEIETVKSSMDAYGATLTEMIDVATKRNDLVTNTLDVLGPEIANLSEKLKLKEKALQDELGPRIVADIGATILFALIVSGIALALGALAAVVVARLISKPIVNMTATMHDIADGNYDNDVPAQDRKDEIGMMAQAVEVFRQNGIAVRNMDAEKAKNLEQVRIEQEARASLQEELGKVVSAAVAGDFSQRIEKHYDQNDLQGLASSVNLMVETVDRGVSETGTVLSALANADLTQRMSGTYQGAFNKLKSDTNAVADKLSDIVGQLRQTSRGLRSATGEILAGANDLSERTTKQAATVEETSAAMEQLAATVAQSAERAEEASLKSRSMSQSAEEGGEVMSQANQAMEQITTSSSKIANIVGLMEDIAFQTNLLALNASVEAARAGEAGKGFAVVAVEVRRLAQSSAEASSEVKQLIEQSGSEVANGSQLVASATEKLEAILEAVMANNELMGGIAKESREQASAITEVNVAVRQMDEMTQHNAALVEETNAAIEQTEAQAADLDRIVDIFRVSDGSRKQTAPASAAASEAKPGVLKKIASGAKALLTQGNAAVDKDWSEF